MAKINKAVAKLDNNIPQVLDILDEQLKSMKLIEETPYKTSGQVGNFENIKNETDISNLIKIHSSAKGKDRAYHESAEDLGLNPYPSAGTDSLADIEHDIKLRIKLITQKETLDKLKQFKAEASKFLSQEDQKGILLNDMAKFLQGLNK